MSKLTKLIKTPKKFFQDTWFFKTENFEHLKSYQNVFVVSHYSQLNIVQLFIETEKLKDCFLVILYTEKNTKMPQLIQKSINKNLFVGSILFLLPNNPNNYNYKSLKIMKNNYEKLLDIIQPKNLYVLSFENHYTLLAHYAKSKNISINLIDEGTATYKNREQSEITKEVSIPDGLILKLLGLETVQDWFIDYDKVYASFPELLKNTFKANEYIKFSAHSGQFNLDIKTEELINYYGITSNDFLYVNQRYAINNEDFVNAIVEILNKISIHKNAKVFIKMHPKDEDAIKSAFIQKITNYNNLVFIKENEFLIEPTIQAINPQGVIGLTSTSLVYAPLVSPYTKVYSIKPWFINLIPSIGNETGIEILNNHFDILKQFKHIIYINSEHDLNNMDNSKLVVKNNNRNDFYQKIARKSYEEGKYQKAVANYGWGYPNIEEMPIIDFEKYIVSINKTTSPKVVGDVFDKWTKYQIIQKKIKSIESYDTLFKIMSDILSHINEYDGEGVVYSILNNIVVIFTNAKNKIVDAVDNSNIDKVLKENFLGLYILKAKQFMVKLDFNSALGIFENQELSENYLPDYLTCLVELNKTKEISDFKDNILNAIENENIKVVCQALIHLYNKDYNLIIQQLSAVLDKFTIHELSLLKPELLIAKSYRLLSDYTSSKSYLGGFEKHSKGNILAHREIAYLEYQFENYKQAILQFEKSFPSIEDMPIVDFEKYIIAISHEEDYENIINILQDKDKSVVCTYYYLFALEKLEKFEEVLAVEKEVQVINIKDKQLVNSYVWIFIRVHRKLGNIDVCINYLENYKPVTTNINDLICQAEIYELDESFDNAFKIWKKIVQDYSDCMPSDAWTRYYHLINLLKL